MNNKEQTPFQTTPFTHDEFYKRYYVHRVAGGAVTVKDDKVLIVKELRRNKYIWGIPGGLLEKGEPLLSGVKREVKEETNIEIEPFCLLGFNNWAGKSIFKEDPYRHAGFTIFLGANYVSGDPQPDGEEVFECKFVSMEELQEFEFAQHLQYIVDMFNAIKKKNYLVLSKNELLSENTYRFMFKPSNFE